jgi:CheY-like chemotaxis protein
MSEPPASGDVPDGAPRVLIVDDEEPVVELLSYVVADAGGVPLTAPHGRRALELAREHWPALLITDLMMPYASGAELIAELRAEAERTGRAPVPTILITGAGIGAARAAGADVVLSKPFELDQIDALVRRFLGDPPASPPAS